MDAADLRVRAGAARRGRRGRAIGGRRSAGSGAERCMELGIMEPRVRKPFVAGEQPLQPRGPERIWPRMTIGARIGRRAPGCARYSAAAASAPAAS